MRSEKKKEKRDTYQRVPIGVENDQHRGQLGNSRVFAFVKRLLALLDDGAWRLDDSEAGDGRRVVKGLGERFGVANLQGAGWFVDKNLINQVDGIGCNQAPLHHLHFIVLEGLVRFAVAEGAYFVGEWLFAISPVASDGYIGWEITILLPKDERRLKTKEQC